MDPSMRFYEQVYDCLGNDFRLHLEEGDLHLYKLNDRGELIKKNHEGRVWIHLSKVEERIASINTAKEMIMLSINALQQKDHNLNSSSITPASANNNINEITALFQFVKVVAVHDINFSKHIDHYGITDPDQLFEIAKIAAAKSESNISQLISNYHLNPLQRFEIAQIVATHNLKGITRHISEFNLSPTQNVEIAKIAARQYGITAIDYFFFNKCDFNSDQWFQIAKVINPLTGNDISELLTIIRNPFKISKLAEIAAISDGAGVSEHITEYHMDINFFSSQRFKIAKIAAAQDGAKTCILIDNYDLTPDQRYEVAKIAAAQAKMELPEFLSNCIDDSNLRFRIVETEPTQLFEIAKFDARKGAMRRTKPDFVSTYIFNTEQRFEIAKIIAECNPRETFDIIANYNLSPAQYYEIATIAASKIKMDFFEFIPNYIHGSNLRFEIVKIAAAKEGISVSKNIDDFRITDTNQRFEIAKIALNEPGAISKYIKNYHIYPDQCFEIAKIIAVYNPSETCRFIANFDLNQAQRFEIAKIVAVYNPSETCRFIANFDLNQAQRFELARIIAKDNAIEISKNIANFHLDSDQQFEIAKIAVRDPKVSSLLSNYLLSPLQSFEIAKIAVECNPKGIWKLIYNLSPVQGYEILNIAAAKSRMELSAFICKFNDDSNLRFAMAKIAAATEGIEVINNFAIMDRTQRLEIAKIVAYNYTGVISRYIEKNSTPARDQSLLYEANPLKAQWTVLDFINNYLFDAEQRFEIAVIAAEYSPEETCKFIANYNLSQMQRFEIAKKIAYRNREIVSENIFNFGLTSDQRFEIAKIVAVAEHDKEKKFKLITNYHLNYAQYYEIVKIVGKYSMKSDFIHLIDSNLRFEIAKFAAEKDGIAVIANFDITDPGQRFEIAKIVSINYSGVIFKYIEDNNISPQNQRFQNATIFPKEQWTVRDFIENYLFDKDQRFEIAKIASDYSPEETCRLIAHYNLNDAQRFEIAKNIAKENGVTVSNYIANFHITDPEQRIKIAKIVQINSRDFIIKYIENYNLTERFEMAKIAIKSNSGEVWRLITNYDLNYAQYYELAKIAAKGKGMQLPQLLRTSDSNFRFELCKLAAEEDGIEVINNFDIADPNQRYEIAKIVAFNYAGLIGQRFLIAMNETGNSLKGQGVVSDPIENYSLDRDQRFEIAKIAAVSSPEKISKLIPNYNFNQIQCFEIAKIVAKNDGKAVSENLANFDIKDRHQRFEIAKIAILNDPKETCRLMANFNISYVQCYEITQFAAKERKMELANFVSTFISDTNLSFEIVKFAAEIDRLDSYNIHEYGITDLAQKLEIVTIQVIHSIVSKNFEHISNMLIQCGDQQLKKALFHQFPVLKLLGERELTIEEIHQYTNENTFYLSMNPIIEEICIQKDLFIRKPLVELLVSFLVLSQLQNILPENMKRCFPLIKELFDFREPTFRFELKETITQTLKDEELLKSWEHLFKLTEGKSFTPLICMYFIPFIRDENKQLVANIIKNRDFQNTRLRNPLIKNLAIIANCKNINTNEKKHIFSNSILTPPFSTNSLEKNIQKVAYLITMKQEQALLANLGRDIDILMNEMIEKSLGLQSIKNSGEKFLNSFGIFRQPNAIFRYIASLERLQQEDRQSYMECISCLSEFTSSVLEGTFPDMRYATHNNRHLETIFSTYSNQGLEEEWRKGAIYKDLFYNASERQRKDFNCSGFLKSKIINDHQLSKDEFPELFTVLSDFEKHDEIKKLLESKLIKKKKKVSKEKVVKVSVGKKSEIELRIKRIKSFQLQFINLIDPNLSLTNEEIEKKLISLLKALNDIYPQKNLQLAKDLEKEIQHLQTEATKQASKYDGWTVCDTDDPCDLLLIGTETQSCQGVDQPPGTCKSLLSYLIDGKNRALVVKNKEGVIISRSIFRLLWDPIKGTAALFLELIYPINFLDTAITNALNTAAQRRAQALNLPLLSAAATNSPYPNPLSSLGGRAPFEYIDAGSRGICGNVWSLSNVYYVESTDVNS